MTIEPCDERDTYLVSRIMRHFSVPYTESYMITKAVAMVHDHNDQIRRECADRFIKNYMSPRYDDRVHYETIEEMFRAWIMEE